MSEYFPKSLEFEVQRSPEHCNIPQLQTSNVQLAKMTEILSRNGWVIDNWPEGIDFPCDLKTGKGLAGLSVEDQEKLLESLNDSSFPLRVVKKSTKGKAHRLLQ